MNKTIRINGQTLTHDSLLERENTAQYNWERDIYQFAAWLTGGEEKLMEFKTSGSTGTPKVISFSKKEVHESAMRTVRYFHLHNHQHFLLCLPAKHVAGRMMIARAWSIGADLIVVPPTIHPLNYLDASITINFAAFTPPQIETALKDGKKSDLEEINKIIIGGSDIKNEVKALLLDMPNNIYQTYGMTETLTHVAVKKISFPADNSYTSISSDIRFSKTPNDSLVVHVNNQVLETTDQVQLLNPYSFVWLGRTDHVINSGGLKIHPEQVEATLINTGVLKENRFYITSIMDVKWGESPCIVSLDAISEDRLQTVNQHLDKYHQIKTIVLEKAFEFTQTGKLIRKKIQNNY